MKYVTVYWYKHRIIYNISILKHTKFIKENDIMKVKIVCNIDNETREVQLPMDEDKLLKIQGQVLDIDTIGYISGADVNYYDEQGNKIENIFLLNRQMHK